MSVTMPAAPHEMQPPKKRCSPSPQQKYNKLRATILETNRRLGVLSALGRPGQWVLHNLDLYDPHLDTRPRSRDPAREVHIGELTYLKAPLLEKGLIWAGTGPVPDLVDIEFWEATVKSLGDKIEQVKARQVQPRFTPAELQQIEALEQQPGHIFRVWRNDLMRNMDRDKIAVLGALFSLAKLGRPGQWILHQEELYHPVIDTRPHTRAAAENDKGPIVLRDATYTGRTLATDSGISADLEIIWAGTGPPPDFAEPDYWEDKKKHLFDRLEQVRAGLVQPQFTPGELQALEAMEQDADHAFAIYALHPPVAETPVVVDEARIKLELAKELLAGDMATLWEDRDLAGKWVLHNERIYIPNYDTHLRERYDDEDDECDDPYRENIPLGTCQNLRFDTRFGPLPDFGDIAYWETKRAELQRKSDDIVAGRLTEHHFSDGDLMTIKLIDQALYDRLDRAYGERFFGYPEYKAKEIEAWLSTTTGDVPEMPPSPLANAADGSGAGQKRKRATDDDDHATAVRPAKVSIRYWTPGRGPPVYDSINRPVRRSARIAALPPRKSMYR